MTGVRFWRDKDAGREAGPPGGEDDGAGGVAGGEARRRGRGEPGARSPGPGEVRGSGGLPAARPRPCSPCQLRRASERSESPDGARGGCSRNRRGPDTSSESSAVKKVADGTSGHKDQLRYPGSEAAMAAVAPAPLLGAGCSSAPSASLRLSPLATAAEAAGSPASPTPRPSPSRPIQSRKATGSRNSALWRAKGWDLAQGPGLRPLAGRGFGSRGLRSRR